MNESPQLQALIALVGVGVFSLVWIGLAASVRKISQRQHNAPSFNVLLNAAHMSRFAGASAHDVNTTYNPMAKHDTP